MQMVIKILPGGAAEQGHQIFWALKRAVSKRRFLTIVYRGKKNWTRKFEVGKLGGHLPKPWGGEEKVKMKQRLAQVSGWLHWRWRRRETL